MWRVGLPLVRTARHGLRVTSVVEEGDGVVSVYLAGRRLDRLRAEEFVLTRPGSARAPGPRGEGWYRITSPVAGWVPSRAISDAALGNCAMWTATQAR